MSRKISNRMAFGSYHVTPPPVKPLARALPPAAEDEEVKEPRQPPQGSVASPDNGAAPYNLTVAEPYVDPIEPFAAQFAGLVIRVPPSVRIQLVERLGRQHYATDSAEPAVRAIIEKAVAGYERKKKSGAAAAAARRAKARESAQARPDASSDEAED